MNKENLTLAAQSWLASKNEVLSKNRFFPQNMEKFHELVDLICRSSTLLIKPDTIFYRARIVDDLEQLCNCGPFWGFDKNNSFVPPKALDNHGRANPNLIRYLYVANDEITAAMETRAKIEDKISVAEIKCNQLLEIADLVYYEEIEKIEECFRFMLAREFSAPSKKDSDYIFSQYVSEYIKSLGYDGVRYNSSLNLSGTNLTIFNWEKCEAISSSVFKVASINMKIKPTTPKKKAQITNKVKYFAKSNASFTPQVYEPKQL